MKNIIAGACIGLCMASPAVAQNKIDISVRSDHFPELEVSVNVRNATTGLGVYNLTPADFRITEEGFAQTSTGFAAKAQGKVDPIDIVFVFDETGSMQDEINAVRDNSRAFVDSLKKLNMDFRLGLVTFSDRVEKVKDFVSDVEVFKGWLTGIRARGGGDEPENALDALHRASQFRFREGAKVVFILITDAPFHSGNAVTKRRMLPVAKKIKLQGIDIYPIAVDWERYRWLANETNGTYFNILKPFSEVLEVLAVKLTAQYRIKYVSTNSAFDNSWRNVDVSAKTWGSAKARYKSKANIKVSSTLVEKNRPSDAYAAQNMVDGNNSTAWNEGVKGDGIGQWVKFDFDKPVKLRAFRIIAGFAKTPRIFRANNRIKKAKLVFSDGQTQVISLKDTMKFQDVLINRALPTSSLKLQVMSVYRGKKFRDTCISEVDFSFHR